MPVNSCYLIATLLLAHVSAAAISPSDKAERIDVQEVVRQAVINFNTREAVPRDYTYVESSTVEHPGRVDGHSDDTYEVIEIKGHTFRRQTVHNGQKVAAQGADDREQDEEYRAKWVEVEHKILEEQIKPGHTPESMAAAVQKIMEEEGLKDWKPQLTAPSPASSMGVVVFAQSLYKFRLPLQELDQSFNLKSKGEQTINGRKTYVVQADPKHTKDNTSDARNFKITIWIDQQDLQIVKAEGKALRDGPLARADYAAFSTSSTALSKREVDQSKQQLADSSLYYSEGTTILHEWTKVNDEAWLLRRRHAKGSHILVVKGQSRFPAANVPLPVEYDTLNTNYKKFRVGHRILPVGSVPQ